MNIEDTWAISQIAEGDNLKGILEVCDAYWKYKEGGPHALLSGGKHSDVYLNISAVLQYRNFRSDLAKRMADLLASSGIQEVDVVLSSSYAALPIGQALADRISPLFFYTEKIDGQQKWTGRFEMPEGARVLQVEDLITTMGTVESVNNSVTEVLEETGSEFIALGGKKVVSTVIHRPDEPNKKYDKYHVISLMEIVAHSWDVGICPLCQKRSEAISPKKNWYLLTGKI